MEELNKKRTEIGKRLDVLNKKKKEVEKLITNTNEAIKEKVELHNELVKSINNIRKDYKTKIEKFGILKASIKNYKKEQRKSLETEYKLQIKNVIRNINELSFDFKLSVFKSFDELKSVRIDMFPILKSKVNGLYDTKRVQLKTQILREIKNVIFDNSKVGLLIFYIKFLIKYENHFLEQAFIEFLFRLITKEFEYHFLTDKESNRLDKPEWVFQFLIKKYSEFEDIFNLYDECSKNEKNTSSKAIITSTQELVFKKLTELMSIESNQKRNLVLHFITQFKEFVEKIRLTYNFIIADDQYKNLISVLQLQHIDFTLANIHEHKYVQWFSLYKQLCKESLIYIGLFGEIDTTFQLQDAIDRIITHLRLFLENLRFINREEIKIAGYVFSELEDLKKFLEVEEENANIIAINDIVASINKITQFNSDVFKLIKNLSINDINNTLKKITYFQFSSDETRRTVKVEVSKIIDEYKICVYSDIIEKIIQVKIDTFLNEEILFRQRLSPDDYLKFKYFFNSIKDTLANYNWKTDEALKSIESFFEGKVLNTQTFQKIKKLYENQ